MLIHAAAGRSGQLRGPDRGGAWCPGDRHGVGGQPRLPARAGGRAGRRTATGSWSGSRRWRPTGVDAVADFVGGQLETSLAVLADGGRLASVADPGVIEYGGRWIWVRPDGAETARLAALADEGKLTVEVAQTFGLDEVAEAFALSRSGHVRGKLIIVP